MTKLYAYSEEEEFFLDMAQPDSEYPGTGIELTISDVLEILNRLETSKAVQTQIIKDCHERTAALAVKLEDLKNMINYPTRCEIVDVTGQEVFPGIQGKTPNVSKPHIGKQGLAERLENGRVRITLDDGNILYGHECWWKSIEAGDE